MKSHTVLTFYDFSKKTVVKCFIRDFSGISHRHLLSSWTVSLLHLKWMKTRHWLCFLLFWFPSSCWIRDERQFSQSFIWTMQWHLITVALSKSPLPASLLKISFLSSSSEVSHVTEILLLHRQPINVIKKSSLSRPQDSTPKKVLT